MLRSINAYCLNEVGGRDQNEDAVWPEKKHADAESRLFMVCDGVGGSSMGEVASELCTMSFAEYFKKNLKPWQRPDKYFVEMARQYTMTHFRNYIERNPHAETMSTTLTLAYLNKESVFIAWCGDSRIYHIRNGNILFQSEDHSLVNEMIRRGELSAEQAQNFSSKNIILRALQFKQPYSEIETAELTDVRTGDYLLLCSDGLLENINAQAIKRILLQNEGKDPLPLFQEYCYQHTRDNYSMYLIELGGAGYLQKKSISTKKYIPLVIAGLLAFSVPTLINWNRTTLQNNEQEEQEPSAPITKEHNGRVLVQTPENETGTAIKITQGKGSLPVIEKEHQGTKDITYKGLHKEATTSHKTQDKDTSEGIKATDIHKEDVAGLRKKPDTNKDTSRAMTNKMEKIKETVRNEKNEAEEHQDKKIESIQKKVESSKSNDSTERERQL